MADNLRTTRQCPKECDFFFFTQTARLFWATSTNEKRRFYTYVRNLMDKIRRVSRPERWKYVPSEANPADVATRFDVDNLDQKERVWLQGHGEFLASLSSRVSPEEPFSLTAPDVDSEVRPCVRRTVIAEVFTPLTPRFEKFSSCDALVFSLCLFKYITKASTHLQVLVRAGINVPIIAVWKAVKATEICVVKCPEGSIGGRDGVSSEGMCFTPVQLCLLSFTISERGWAASCGSVTNH